MCGIIWYTQKTWSIRGWILTQWLDILHTRWPDNSSVYEDGRVSLGHARLSIIDTSSWANQPFHIENFTIVFNGEIYNYKKVRDTLIQCGHEFRTTSDTEVLLRSYIEWWEQCTEFLDGIWAFCIYDRDKNILFLSRDRIWEKPLIYIHGDDYLAFASEIPALLDTISEDQKIPDIEALSQFWLYNFRHIPAPYTAYKNIYKLEPWYSMALDLASFSLTKKKYFTIEKQEILSDPVDTCEKLLREAVEQTCYAEVPVGILLSGWVDSSLVAAMMKDRDITTYSLGWNEEDEEIIRADAIAKHLWIKNKKIYFESYMKDQNLIELIRKNISHYGEPVNLFQIIYSNILLDEMKKDGIKVVVGWNGADELFYGYDGMNTLALISKIKSFLDVLWLERILSFWKKSRPFSLKNSEVKSALYTQISKSREYIVDKYRIFLYENQFLDYSRDILSSTILDIFSWLGLRIENEHSITLVADLSGSMNGMEVRTPFLNKEILSFSCNLDKKYKIRSLRNKKENKYILKKVLCRYLGEDLVYKKKMWFGYGVRFDNILQENKDEVSRYFENILPRIPLYDTERVLEMWRQEISLEKKSTHILTDILIVCIWWEQFIL